MTKIKLRIFALIIFIPIISYGTIPNWPGNPSLVFTNDITTGIYNPTVGTVSIATNNIDRLNVDISGNISISQFGTGTGVIHNNSSGNLTNSLIINSDITPGTITNTSIATGAAIADTKLATISTDGKVANSATTATNASTGNTIVLRDSSGNFNAGTINSNITGNITGNVTGNVTGNADTATTAVDFSGPVGTIGGDITGLQTSMNVNTVGGLNATGISAGANLANAATSLSTADAIVRRSAAGNFAANIITANLIGNITGSCFGNANTSTYATTSGSTSILTGAFGASGGNITGYQNALTVDTVGSKTASQISQATDLVLSATSNNVANSIIKRDSLGNFTANMITLNTGAITNPTDATTKAYVDSVATGGLVPKTPAIVVSTSDTTISGLQTIDSVTLIDSDRVLLVNQTNQIQNGLWLSHSGSWTRPTDFFTGDMAQGAYVLINSGAINAGTSWLCSTPNAIIGTNSIQFTQFSLPDQTTAANVGSGAGQIFKDKNGITLNLKTLAALSHVTITNNASDIGLGTDATDANTASTIISRDANGNFSASNMTGAASANVLKSGDSMTGNLNLNTNSGTRSEIKLQDATGSGYVGLRSPATVGTSYTIDLPSVTPAANQFLQATSSSAPFTTQWASFGSPLPAAAKTYYVSLAGNNSNDGSFSAPFRTVKYAVTQANNLPASTLNPIVISIGAGIFSEDNSGGGIQINVDGINIIGSSLASTIIVPQQVTSDDLFVVTKPNTEFYNLILKAATGGSTKSAIKLTTTTYGTTRFSSIGVSSFYNAFEINCSDALPLILFDNAQCTDNTTCISITNGTAVIKSSVFQGTSTATTPANNFLYVVGANSQVDVIGCGLKLLDTCINATAGIVRISASNIENSNNGIICQNGCKCYITSLNSILNQESSINVWAKDSGTVAYVEGSMFDCKNALSGIATGTAIKCTNAAIVNLSSTTIENAGVGLEVNGTITTTINANGLNLIHCPIDILQRGTSSLNFVGGTIENSYVDFEDPTNISLAAFNSNGETTMSFGNTTDSSQTIYLLQNGQPVMPNLTYEPNYYGNKGPVYKNSNTGANTAPTLNAIQADNSDASLYVVTGKNTNQAKINLISDTANIGSDDNVRGWEISKLGNTGADLAFTYTNSDPGLSARGKNTVMRLNGFNNQIEFPCATNTPLPTSISAKLAWAPEIDSTTNLYRYATGTLQTDGNLIVSGNITGNLIGNLTGAASLNVLKSGDTMTGNLNMSGNNITGAGSIYAAGMLSSGSIGADIFDTKSLGSKDVPAYRIGGVSTGIFSSDYNKLNISSNAHNMITFDYPNITVPTGVNFLSNLTGNVTGAASLNVLKSGDTMTGNLTMGGNNITGAGIVNATNLVGALTGNVTGNVTGNLIGNVTGAASLNVLKSGDSMSGNLTMGGNNITGAGIVNATNLVGALTGNVTGNVTGNLIGNVTGAASLNVLKSGDTMTGNLTMDGNNITGAGTVNAINLIGALTGNVTGNVTGNLIGNVTGAASLNILKSGDTMTGNLTMGGNNITGAGIINANQINVNTLSVPGLQLQAGTSSSPSLTFGSSTTSGIYSSATDKINISSLGTNLINFDNEAGYAPSVTIPAGVTLTANGLSVFNNSTTLNDAATFNNSTTTNNIATFNSKANFNGQINLNGTNNLVGTTNISGLTTFSGTTNIATELNLSSGGTQTNPTITFNNDLKSGIYSTAANNISICASGAQQLNVYPTGVSINNTANFATGVNITGTTNFSTGVNITGRLTTSTGANIAGPLNVTGLANFTSGATFATGSATNPSINFNGSTNSGLYCPAANQVSISASGVQQLNAYATGISVNNYAKFSTDVNISGVLTTASNTNIVGNLNVTGATNLNSTLTTASNTNIGGNLNVTGISTFNNYSTFNSSATFNYAATFKSNIVAAGTQTFNVYQAGLILNMGLSPYINANFIYLTGGAYSLILGGGTTQGKIVYIYNATNGNILITGLGNGDSYTINMRRVCAFIRDQDGYASWTPMANN